MPETQTLGRKRIRVISLFAMLGLLTTALVVWAGTELSKKIIADRQAALVAVLRKNVVDSPAFLVERLRELQSKNIFLFVPGMKKPVSFSVGLFSFDPKAFPESLIGTLQGAHSTEEAIKVSTKGLNLIRTIVPGSYRTGGTPIILP